MRNKLKRICIVLGLFLTSTNSLLAQIKLPAIFGDNMVLQRNIKVPIWGWAKAGEKIQIIFKNQVFKTTTGSDGKWYVKLGSYKAGGPYQMFISNGEDQLNIKNILIGDVWITSGQSNMEFGIQTEKQGTAAIAKATDTLIHFFYVPMAYALQPQNNITPVAPADSPNGKWVVCSPQIMANPKWAWHGFSAVGYYFAQQIRNTQGCPVGMIGTYKGGTPAQLWISIEALQQKTIFANYVSKHQQQIDNYDKAKETYPQQLSAYRDELSKWNKEIGKDFDVATRQWQAEAARAKANGLPQPVQPKPLRPAPKEPLPPEGGFSIPSNCYNAMVAPIVGYGIKGVLWYQGESNGDRLADAVEYKELFPLLISTWRNNWHQGRFPFLFVQLANHHAPAITPSEGYWPWVREAQFKALSMPATGMAVITDIGEADNIHPLNKKDVGLRLSLVARHLVYGEKLVSSGPVFKSIKITENNIKLTFDDNGSGLTAGNMPQNTDTLLKGFGVAGADKKFIWAKAVIDGNSIIVSADGIKKPVAVRYNWGDNPPGNLYNKDGLPAPPFRTDDWLPPLTPVTK